MGKESTQAHYRTNSRNVQLFMDEVKAERMIPSNDSVRLLDQTVDEMNLHSPRSSCKRLGRKPAARPITLFKVLVYANMEGIYSSRDIASACRRDMNFIDRQFEQAGKVLGEGLHRQYWRRHAERNSVDVKAEIMILVNDATARDNLEKYAEERFNVIWNKHQTDVATLPKARKTWYRRLIRSSETPQPERWELPESIGFRVSDDSQPFDNHLYIKEDGTFSASLNPWEMGVMKEELENGAVCWLRNLDRKPWSLGIPYEVNGTMTNMYPDILIVRAGTYGYIFDIMEPHDESRKDNYPKAVGLAKFADLHWDKFGRIQLIRRKPGPDGRDHFYCLDMANAQIRNRVRAIHSNIELDRIFDECATLI